MKRPKRRKRKWYTRRRHNQQIKKRLQWLLGGVCGFALAGMVADSTAGGAGFILIVSVVCITRAANWW